VQGVRRNAESACSTNTVVTVTVLAAGPSPGFLKRQAASDPDQEPDVGDKKTPPEAGFV
jgi:hypothetical protein